MSISLRLAVPAARPAPVLLPRRPPGSGGCSPVAVAASWAGAPPLRGCASLPLSPRPQPLGMGKERPCRRRGGAAVCHASAYLSARTMQWVSAGATAVLLLAKGELELPLSTMLLVSVAPYQMMNLRGTQGGAVLSLALAAYLAFQHFTRAGGVGRTFDQGSIVATLAIICITVINLVLLF